MVVPIVVLLIGLTATVLGQTSEQIHEQCHKLDCKSIECCDVPGAATEIAAKKDLIKECLELPMASCERMTCIATKLGFGTADGKLDRTKVTEKIDRDFEGHPAISAPIKEKCVNGDLSIYGPPDECELLKFDHCLKINLLGRCPNWKTDDHCTDIKKITENCYKFFS